VLFIWQLFSTLNSGGHQAMTQELRTFIETKSVKLQISFCIKKYIEMCAKYISKNSLKKVKVNLKINKSFI